MRKTVDTTERPMGLQPEPQSACTPMQPPMPVAGEEPVGPVPEKPEPSREEAMQAAKANLIRRESLKKQQVSLDDDAADG
jgi:hypothetical protein